MEKYRKSKETMKRTKKIVCLPIEVPVGDYCWGWNEEDDGHLITILCQYFNNEGGHPKCELGLDWKPFQLPKIYKGLEYDKEGEVRKPDYCNNLKIPFNTDELDFEATADRDE